MARSKKLISTIVTLAIAAFVLWQLWDGTIKPLISELSGGQAIELTTTGDYVEVTGQAVRSYDISQPGTVAYCPLDDLDRAVCAYGLLTPDMRDSAKESGREDITVDPAGWGANSEVTIPALAEVEGSKDYSGWFWNRSHLLADSLGGNAVKENLVTGTRTQNVGSTTYNGQYNGGMAFTERVARDYLDSQEDSSCPLYYAATANYDGDELVPRTVTVELLSCDESVNIRAEVSNTANGWAIDYANGTYRMAE